MIESILIEWEFLDWFTKTSSYEEEAPEILKDLDKKSIYALFFVFCCVFVVFVVFLLFLLYFLEISVHEGICAFVFVVVECIAICVFV